MKSSGNLCHPVRPPAPVPQSPFPPSGFQLHSGFSLEVACRLHHVLRHLRGALPCPLGSVPPNHLVKDVSGLSEEQVLSGARSPDLSRRIWSFWHSSMKPEMRLANSTTYWMAWVIWMAHCCHSTSRGWIGEAQVRHRGGIGEVQVGYK